MTQKALSINVTTLYKNLSMNNLDIQYQRLLSEIYLTGIKETNRTGISAYTLPSAIIKHDMADGFPLLTIKRVPFKVMAVELEGFIKGITSKKWYQERGCHIWDEWCNPQKVFYGHDTETRKKMLEEDDLGLIYGSQWRNFHDPNAIYWNLNDEIENYSKPVDQLKNIVDTLKKNPQDRRMICSAWNPLALNQMALPPCHMMWQVSVIGGKLHLSWTQRSCDVPLGIPFNIASYGLLLHLLAKESGYEEGTLTGFLSNVHYYENQKEGVEEIIGRDSNFDLPTIETSNFTSVFDWKYNDSTLKNYQCLSTIKIPIAV